MQLTKRVRKQNCLVCSVESFMGFVRGLRFSGGLLRCFAMKFLENINLSGVCNYRIGGPAKLFFEAKNVDDLRWAISEAKRAGAGFFVLGSGTNVLFGDNGFDGLVLRPDIKFIESDGGAVRVGAGVSVSELLNHLVGGSLSGMEWAGGLPGTFGGAVRGNAGAFKGEIKDVVLAVESLDTETGEVIRRNRDDCRFAYRSSVFKERDGKEIILSANISLKNGNSDEIARAVQEKIDYRKKRHPLEYPNIGSMFKNVDLKIVPESVRALFAHMVKTDPFPVVPTAYLISETGLKGVSFGGAMISPKHPNFIVNVLNASQKDVLSLINLVKSEVKDKFGIVLEEEVKIL